MESCSCMNRAPLKKGLFKYGVCLLIVLCTVLYLTYFIAGAIFWYRVHDSTVPTIIPTTTIKPMNITQG